MTRPCPVCGTMTDGVPGFTIQLCPPCRAEEQSHLNARIGAMNAVYDAVERNLKPPVPIDSERAAQLARILPTGSARLDRAFTQAMCKPRTWEGAGLTWLEISRDWPGMAFRLNCIDDLNEEELRDVRDEIDGVLQQIDAERAANP